MLESLRNFEFDPFYVRLIFMIYRKSLSLTNVVETIVQELKKLLLVHSLVVLATKGTIYEEKYPANENNRKVSSNDHFSGNVASKAQQPPFREFMPSSWQVKF
jgi:DNA-repair protein XRCC2